MRSVFSFGVNDSNLVEAINEFKARGGNLSGLINYLLKNYFFGDGNHERILTKEMMFLNEIKDKLQEFEEWKKEILPKIEKLEEELSKKQEMKQQEEDASIITLLRETKFSDFIDDPIKKLEDMEFMTKKIGKTPRDAINARLDAFALENKIPVEKVKGLFFKAFPELEGKIKL
jgi:hypothetical protein